MRKRYQLLNVDVNNFQKFCEWKKMLAVETLLLNVLRIYLLMLKALKSVFLCILLNENYCLDWPNSFIVLCVHTLNLSLGGGKREGCFEVG